MLCGVVVSGEMGGGGVCEGMGCRVGVWGVVWGEMGCGVVVWGEIGCGVVGCCEMGAE